jgi:hypothetical protein
MSELSCNCAFNLDPDAKLGLLSDRSLRADCCFGSSL